ncbi:MAG: hypothetical protein A3G83_01260 [Betaproteobacteria bacterium RIFCSPLOWO2_12_FULL_68_20]|nr:MAG: hypothetical protein A3G83_01260 [Betaproteobacteria bacterium RIFCSPLOWO2_12_FULL_68_20]
MSHAPGGGVLSPVRHLARTLLSFVETRARLAANEVEEQWLRLTEVVIWGLAALLCAGVALVMLSLIVVLLFRDGERLLAAGLVAAAWIAAAVACALVMRARRRQRPKLLAATLAELQKDRERFEKLDA